MLKLRRQLLRRFSPRLLVAALLCALVLNGIAYLTHRHSSEEYRGNAAHAELCGLCTVFGSLGAEPVAPAAINQLPLALILLALSFPLAAPLLRRFATSARPRAPPYS